MKLAQVGKYLPEGIRAWSNLMNMIFEAASTLKVSAKIKVTEEDIGFNLDGKKYWVGIDYEEPENLWFSTQGQIDTAAAERLPIGELDKKAWAPGGYRWCHSAELESEPIHFFARSKVGQMEWLEGFLRECLTMARSIETPDQPPIPDEPEGN